MEETEVSSTTDTSTQTEESEMNYQTTVFKNESAARACLECIFEMVLGLLVSEQLDLMSKLFSSHACEHHDISIPKDFLKLVLDGLKHLRTCSRSNVIYGLARGIGSMRDDGSDSKLPARRMPTGLLEHMINFFNADQVRQVSFLKKSL